MNKVSVSYNPYLPELKINVNGRRLPEYSALMKYKHRPFSEWAGVFFDEIAREVNDSYELSYVGTVWEKDILERLGENDALCSSFSYAFPEIADDITDRLMALQSLGDREPASEVSVGIWAPDRELCSSFCDMLLESGVFEEEEDGLTSDAFPLTSISVKMADALREFSRMDLGFAFLPSESYEEAEDTIAAYGKPLTVVTASGFTGFSRLEGNHFFFDTDGSDTVDLFMNAVMEMVLPAVLSDRSYHIEKEVDAGHIRLSGEERERLSLLTSTCKKVQVMIPGQLYVGRTLEIGTSSEKEAEGLNAESENGLIRVCGMSLTGTQAGRDRISVFQEGDPDPVAFRDVKIVDAVLINEIRVFPKVKYIPEGIDEQLDLQVLPENAVNVSELKTEMEDPTVAVIDLQRHMVRGLRVGKSVVRIGTPDVQTEMTIIVQPHVRDIILPTGHVNLSAGESIRWKPRMEPEDSFEQLRIISSSPSTVEYRDGFLTAKKTGTATIMVSTQDGNLRRECRVEVGRKFHF